MLQEEESTSLQHCNLVHTFIPMPQAMKIPAATAVDKEWEKLEKIPAWDLTKSEKSEVIDEARTKGMKVHVASLVDICHLKNAELETKAPKIQRQQESWISYPDRQVAQDKQLTQYLLIPR